MMSPPFSAEDFFRVFADYNTAVWPAQILLNALALVAVMLALRGGAVAGRTIAGILSLLWLWMAVAYHWAFFAQINPAARGFAVAFMLEGALLGWLALRRSPPEFRPALDGRGVLGGLFVLYALAVYPLLGMLAGHGYPAQPTFGLPCPTTIFTIGLLLWASTRVPWFAVVVPAAWSVLGLSAVRYFGVIEDAMLPVAGLLGGALVLLRREAQPVGRGPQPDARERAATESLTAR